MSKIYDNVLTIETPACAKPCRYCNSTAFKLVDGKPPHEQKIICGACSKFKAWAPKTGNILRKINYDAPDGTFLKAGQRKAHISTIKHRGGRVKIFEEVVDTGLRAT